MKRKADTSQARDSAWHALLEALPHAAWLVEPSSRRICAANAAANGLLAAPGRPLVGRDAATVLPGPEDQAWWQEQARGTVAPASSHTMLASADGRWVEVERSLRPLACGDTPAHILVTVRDRSPEQQREYERESQLEALRATLEATADGLLVLDRHGRVRAANARLAELWRLPEDVMSARQAQRLFECLRLALADATTAPGWFSAEGADGRAQEARTVLQLRDGRVLECRQRPLQRAPDDLARVLNFRDISHELECERRLESLALSDSLTGLPNRRHLRELASAALGETPAPRLALLVLDLDRFGQVNDGLGHLAGDHVLLDVTTRLRGALRPHDILSRTGGDQFAVLMRDADAAQAEAIARRLLHVVEQPTRTGGHAAFTLTCSVGIALAPAHGSSIDELLRHAESALREVKRRGRRGWRVHQAQPGVDLKARLQLDHAMRQGLAAGRFALHFQPQIRLADGATVGAEALLRWHDPVLGNVPPGQFIPVAEDSGFIVELGDWVLAQAVRQAAQWHEQGLSLPVAVNVSALQFQQPRFVEEVAAILAISGLPARLLELELTESILVRDADDALQRLQALAGLGVRLAIDDFGTGYSSLAYLKRLPIARLKIDRSFIAGVPGEPRDAGIVRAVLQMAAALDLGVIAEGVETPAQRDHLRAAGCDEAQGFLFSRAVPPEDFVAQLHPVARARAGASRLRLVQPA